ncbi:transposon Ty3-I Gag-Pol polyprotein [Trichonephila clavipes]|nr:transposon Ty3-I Gag-Pol polyprotein [Trichonephila clavipes]
MTGNQLDVIIDKKPIRALVDSGASFSVISDKYRRFLKKVLFVDAKSVMLKVADGNFVRPIGKCVLRVRINNRELPFEFIVLSHCSHDVILGWDFLEASQAVIDCGQNELVLEDICRDSTAPDAWNLYATRDYTLKPHSLTRITVSGYQTRGDINVVPDGSKHLLFEKNIATPSMVSTYRNGKSDVWVTNLQFRNQIIPRGMCIGQAEPLNEGHLCVISDTSGCLDDQQETSESQMNCSLMMSPELSDEQRNKLSELLRKFSGLFTKTDKSTAAKTNVKHRIFTGDHAPINQRAYRVSPTERRIIHEEVQKMLDEGIVQPSESPWCHVLFFHGAPRVIITDRGAVFRSRLVSSLVDLCNIDHRFTTAYHPQTNGLTERFNKTLADMLSMYVDVEQKNWDEILPFVTFAYNTAKQETTGFTPFYLLHGREAETTLDTMLPFCPNDFDDNNITKIAARAEESRQLARVHTLRAQDKDRRRYDSKHQMVSYAPGDLVWVYTPVLDESRSFFRVHTGYFSNIPKCIKAEFIASWACSQSSVVSSSQR